MVDDDWKSQHSNRDEWRAQSREAFATSEYYLPEAWKDGKTVAYNEAGVRDFGHYSVKSIKAQNA